MRSSFLSRTWASLFAASALVVASPAMAQSSAEVKTESEQAEVEVETDDVDAGAQYGVEAEVEGEEVQAAEVRREATVQTQSEPWLGTMLGSTVGGAAVGALVGGAVYLIGHDGSFDGFDWGYVGVGAGAGALVGLGVGVLRVGVTESRIDEATATRRMLPSDYAKAYGVSYRLRF